MRTADRRPGRAWAGAGRAIGAVGVALLGATAWAWQGGSELAPRPPDPASPRVVAAWPAGPMEVRVAFDAPVDPEVAARAVGRSARFEPKGAAGVGTGAGRPGGDGGSIRVAAARLVDGGRTLALVTDPHPQEATYRLPLLALKAPGAPGDGRSEVVAYALAGVEATWTPEGDDATPAWAGWWPGLDPAQVRAALTGSSEHEKLWPLLQRPGKLALRSFVALPAGPVAATVASNADFEATLGSETARSAADHRASIRAEATAEPTEVGVTLTTAPGREPSLGWSYAAGDPPSALRTPPPSAFGLPWGPPPLPAPAPPTIPPGLAEGGDPARGAVVFASEAAKCSSCHRVRGQGGQVGPDLSDLSRASRAWVYQNIVEPSASIHPDYVAYTVALKDGRVSMGVVRAEGADALRVADIDAKFTTFPRAEVEEIRPSTSSIMPVGLLGAIGDDQARDLLAFLTSPDQPLAADTAPRTVPTP